MSTIYSSLSDKELKALYLHDLWMGLSADERLSLLQETVDRELTAVVDAENVPVCTVRYSDLQPSTMGYQEDHSIFINRDVFTNDRMTQSFFDRNGKHELVYELEHGNYLAYNLIQHELTHFIQNCKEAGLIPAEPQEVDIIKANRIEVTTVNGERACRYMNSDFMMYYLNPTERQAFQAAEEKTLSLIAGHQENHAPDKAMKEYFEEVRKEGYSTRIKKYAELFGTENLPNEIDQVLLNAYRGTNLPVNKNIEAAVHKAMIETQQRVDKSQKHSIKTMEENNMAINVHQVSQAEYDQALNAAINGFYNHCLAQGMTESEARIATYPMSESALKASEDFNQAQRAATAAQTSAITTPTVENPNAPLSVVAPSAENTTAVTTEVTTTNENVNTVTTDLDQSTDNENSANSDPATTETTTTVDATTGVEDAVDVDSVEIGDSVEM